MATVHTGQIYPASITATSAAGYDAVNLGNPRIRKSWRSTDTTQQQIIIDLGADVTVASLWLQHCNAASVALETKTAAGAYVAAGTLTLQQEPHGRRKGWAAVPGTYRYLRLTIAAGVPADGAAYWEVGAIYVFGTSTTLARGPEWPLQINPQYPQVLTSLPNGRPVRADAGPIYALISMEFRPLASEDAALLLRQARAATVGLSLDLTPRPWDAWPVTHVQGNAQIRAENAKNDLIAVELVEVV